jgi:hypothetical protein
MRGQWHTHIDYDAFNAAWRKWDAEGGALDPLTYAVATPDWVSRLGCGAGCC